MLKANNKERQRYWRCSGVFADNVGYFNFPLIGESL